MDFLIRFKKRYYYYLETIKNKGYIMAKLQYTYTVDILKQDALYKTTHPGNSCRNLGDAEI